MNWQKFALGGVAFVVITGIYVGLQQMGKANDAKKVKEELTSICADDKECVAAVNTHFQDCFDTSYTMGGRRRASTLNSEKLATCLNGKAGKDYFSVKNE
jgi:uncharacterized protein (UPF0333 family)